MNHRTELHAARLDALEGRLAVRLAAGLSERADALPHDISERLRFSRERAIQRRRTVQAAGAAAPVGVSRAGAATLGRLGGVWLQFASWAPLALLLAGLLFIEQWSDHEQVLAAAEIDAVLLADDLPPAAWADPGFREYMKTPNP